jgi:hypothetical protein
MEYQRLRSITFDSDTEIYTYDVAESNSDEVEICVSRNKVEALSVPAGTFALSIRAVHSLLHLPILVGTYAQGFGAGNHARFVRDYLSMQGLDDIAEKMDSVEQKPKESPRERRRAGRRARRSALGFREYSLCHGELP